MGWGGGTKTMLISQGLGFSSALPPHLFPSSAQCPAIFPTIERGIWPLLNTPLGKRLKLGGIGWHGHQGKLR